MYSENENVNARKQTIIVFRTRIKLNYLIENTDDRVIIVWERTTADICFDTRERGIKTSYV